MGCLESLPYEVLMKNISFKEAREHLSGIPEKYDVPPGFELFGIRIIGVPPIRIAIDNNSVIFPFTKPCYGTFLVKVKDADEEIAKIRSLKLK